MSDVSFWRILTGFLGLRVKAIVTVVSGIRSLFVKGMRKEIVPRIITGLKIILLCVVMLVACACTGYVGLGLWAYVSVDVTATVILSAMEGNVHGPIFGTLAMVCTLSGVGIAHIMVIGLICFLFSQNIIPWFRESWQAARATRLFEEGGLFHVSRFSGSGSGMVRTIFRVEPQDPVRPDAIPITWLVSESEGYKNMSTSCYSTTMHNFTKHASLTRVDPLDLPLCMGFPYHTEEFADMLQTLGQMEGIDE